MVRKAETLKSLDELNFSARAKTYLNNNFDSIDGVIRWGRVYAFKQELDVRSEDRLPKWKSELISALKDAGFIRPATDFLMSFRVGDLYRSVYGAPWAGYFVTDIEQLSNVKYEEFEGLSDEYIRDAEVALMDRLTEREYEVIRLRFGLDYLDIDSPKDLKSIGNHFGISGERVRICETTALRKLRHPTTKLPAIFDAPSDLEEVGERLYAELEELYQSPVFMRANEIVHELERMKKAPFNYDCEYFKGGDLAYSNIDTLGLSTRTCVILKRANIFTVSDIVNLPKDDWYKIRNFGRKSSEEVVARMHTLGYEDFSI